MSRPHVPIVSGEQFGLLTVLVRVPSVPRQGAAYLCVCECGQYATRVAVRLRNGSVRSCGCLPNARPGYHFTRTATIFTERRHEFPKEYRVWQAMKSRCLNPNVRSWVDYGGRGVGICQRWIESFDAFLDDMGPKPAPGYSIERRDNDRGYQPDNCYWATATEQARNTRRTVRLEYDGLVLSLAEWSERTGVGYTCLAGRVAMGWSAGQALGFESPPQNHRPDGYLTKKAITINGVTKNGATWARELGLSREAIRQRLLHGWSYEEAVTLPKGTQVRTGDRRKPSKERCDKGKPSKERCDKGRPRRAYKRRAA